MIRYQITTRRCATCQSWEGERLGDTQLRLALTPHHAVAGYCRSSVGWWMSRMRQAESACCFWQQWSLVEPPSAGRTQSGLVMLDSPMDHSEYTTPPPE